MLNYILHVDNIRRLPGHMIRNHYFADVHSMVTQSGTKRERHKRAHYVHMIHHALHTSTRQGVWKRGSWPFCNGFSQYLARNLQYVKCVRSDWSAMLSNDWPPHARRMVSNHVNVNESWTA